MTRLCVSCGSEIPANTPIAVYNINIDKCKTCYLNNIPSLYNIKKRLRPKTKIFSIRINKNLTPEQTKTKLIKLARKIKLYISSNE